MKTHCYCFLAVLALAVCVTPGCTFKYNFVKAHSLVAYDGAERIAIPVELRLSPEYRQAQWQLAFMGKTVVPFGAHLTTNTIEFAKGTFANVLVTTNGTPGAPAPNVSGLLVPRLVYVDCSGANLAKGYLTMALEWSFFDASGKLIWVDSYRSEFRGPPEGVSGNKRKIQKEFDIVLEDLFKQSRRGMLASPEIKQYAQSTPAAASK